MNDPQDTTVTAAADPVVPAPGVPATDPQKSPLDLLEEILGDNKTAVPQASAAEEPAATLEAPPAETAPPGPTLEDVQALEAQQAIADQAAAAVKLQEIQAEVSGTQHQDQVHQEQAQQQKATDKTDSQAGFEINQVDHTKI